MANSANDVQILFLLLSKTCVSDQGGGTLQPVLASGIGSFSLVKPVFTLAPHGDITVYTRPHRRGTKAKASGLL